MKDSTSDLCARKEQRPDLGVGSYQIKNPGKNRRKDGTSVIKNNERREKVRGTRRRGAGDGGVIWSRNPPSRRAVLAWSSEEKGFWGGREAEEEEGNGLIYIIGDGNARIVQSQDAIWILSTALFFPQDAPPFGIH